MQKETLKPKVQDASSVQDFNLQPLAGAGEHSQVRKAPAHTSDCSIKNCPEKASLVSSFKVHSSSILDTEKVALELSKELKAGSVLAFFGDLGTGKTTFIRSLAHELCDVAPEAVSSPTFQYLNIYKGKKTLYHFDLYRIKNAEDFLNMGFDEVLDQDGITCIEWAERVEEILPPDTIRINITHEKENVRLIEIAR